MSESVTAAAEARALRVLHVVNVETSNYYLNNLHDLTDPREVTYGMFTFGARGGFVEEFERRGVKVWALDALERARYPRAAHRLWEVIEEGGYHIVHTHLYDPTLIGVALGRLRGRKVVVTRHHSDAIHQIAHPLKRSAYLAGERWVNRLADHIIAPSRMVRDILVEREGVPSEKVSIIPYGQTEDRFRAVTAEAVARARSELGMDGRVALVCVSRLHPEKGHRHLFAALSELARGGLDFALYLVGTGPILEELKERAREEGIGDRVRFLGWRDDALAIVAAADAVVHPSLHEALPSAVIEALMLERPLVVTDVSGVRDMVGDDAHGMIVPPGDAQAFARALALTLGDLEAARERARRGHQFIREYMSAARVAKEYVTIYRRVAARG